MCEVCSRPQFVPVMRGTVTLHICFVPSACVWESAAKYVPYTHTQFIPCDGADTTTLGDSSSSSSFRIIVARMQLRETRASSHCPPAHSHVHLGKEKRSVGGETCCAPILCVCAERVLLPRPRVMCVPYFHRRTHSHERAPRPHKLDCRTMIMVRDRQRSNKHTHTHTPHAKMFAQIHSALHTTSISTMLCYTRNMCVYY